MASHLLIFEEIMPKEIPLDISLKQSLAKRNIGKGN